MLCDKIILSHRTCATKTTYRIKVMRQRWITISCDKYGHMNNDLCDKLESCNKLEFSLCATKMNYDPKMVLSPNLIQLIWNLVGKIAKVFWTRLILTKTLKYHWKTDFNPYTVALSKSNPNLQNPKICTKLSNSHQCTCTYQYPTSNRSILAQIHHQKLSRTPFLHLTVDFQETQKNLQIWWKSDLNS